MEPLEIQNNLRLIPAAKNVAAQQIILETVGSLRYITINS